jgi:putative ABC transport system permease protein
VHPLIFYYKNWSSSNIIVKVSGNNILETMQLLEKNWENISGGSHFTYHFMNDSFDKLYKKESVMLDILQIFVLIAIIISSLGLLGMVAFIIARRTKEIGIRKVLGASIPSILNLLTKEFLVLFIIANIFAIPIAYYFMNKWLQNFAYKIEIGIIPFAIAGLTVLVIALLTISIQTTKAALANPVDSLRSE